MNEVALRANDVLRNDVGYANDVALRANGIKPFAWCTEIPLIFLRAEGFELPKTIFFMN